MYNVLPVFLWLFINSRVYNQISKKTDKGLNMPYHETRERRVFYLPPKRTMKPLLLSKAIEGFVLACKARKLSEHTLTDYERTMRKFVAHVGDSPIQKITSTQVAAFLASQPWSAKTVLNYHIGLSALWTWAVKEGYVERHILRQVDKPRPQKIAVAPFTDTEIRAMMASVKRNADRDRAIILLLLDTGLRASELCGLELSDIDLANKRLKVLGKGNKERLLPFSSRTASALFRYLSTENPARPFPFTRTSLAHLVQDIGRRAGIRDAHPHRFRHTFAVTYLRLGGDPYTLQAILGHSTMEMVKNYLALAQVDVDAAHRRASPVENWRL
jgi:integrase/recombinase XerD